jgi:GNAT superfamily N-acetyltransferase
MNGRELMETHLDALFRHDAKRRLVAVNEPEGRTAPRFFLGTTATGCVLRYRFDVPDILCRALDTAALDLGSSTTAWNEPIDPAPFRAHLVADAPVQHVWAGPAFVFPAHLPTSHRTQRVTADQLELLRPYLGGWIADVVAGRPLCATVIGDAAVAVCCSVRLTATAHEAGVETAEAFRGRGFAAAAVAEWARDIRARGLIPLYSTSWTNSASRAVARKLKLVQFGSDLHIT